MMYPPNNPRDVDFTELEAILRTHGYPPLGTYVEIMMGRVLDAEFLEGWREGPLIAPDGLDSGARGA